MYVYAYTRSRVSAHIFVVFVPFPANVSLASSAGGTEADEIK